MSKQPPVTEADLRRDLRALGIEPGCCLMVHSSLRAVGWVLGGAPTVVRALLDSLGPEGTLAMPAATPMNVDPVSWPDPVDDRWLELVRDHWPLFDPATTPTSLGIVPETFRNWPGTRRSGHPVESVCARGPVAAEITASHPWAFSEGAEGPFGRLHEKRAQVLLLGVGFNRCTALHYAESLASTRRTTVVRFPVEIEGRRTWVEAPNVADDNDTHFPEVGRRYLAAGRARTGAVGGAAAVLFSMADLVPFATRYFESEL